MHGNCWRAFDLEDEIVYVALNLVPEVQDTKRASGFW